MRKHSIPISVAYDMLEKSRHFDPPSWSEWVEFRIYSHDYVLSIGVPAVWLPWNRPPKPKR